MTLASTADTPTSCVAHTRLYRGGELSSEGFPVAAISDHLAEQDTVVWLDLEDPDQTDLQVIVEELGLHPLAVEDAVNDRQRPKVDRYTDHLFLNAYLVSLDVVTGELHTREIAAFVTERALVTVRKDATIEVEPLLATWDESRQNASSGVSFLLHGLLDHVVDGHFATVQELDEAIDGLEDLLFDPAGRSEELQRRSFELRKSLVQLRRVVLPMREVVNTLLRRDLGIVGADMAPYYQDVYDHVLRASEWTESLRDLVASVLETNLTMQGNRLNETVRKLTAYAAILAVTTAVTGFYGQNVPYPGFGQAAGFATSVTVLVLSVVGLYVLFKRKGYL
ncbi:MAG: magnesium transporter CorA family protein [Frankiales bacterium]|nr:magnesium transporter CorA family protein [Frankiales bacterium]